MATIKLQVVGVFLLLVATAIVSIEAMWTSSEAFPLLEEVEGHLQSEEQPLEAQAAAATSKPNRRKFGKIRRPSNPKRLTELEQFKREGRLIGDFLSDALNCDMTKVIWETPHQDEAKEMEQTVSNLYEFYGNEQNYIVPHDHVGERNSHYGVILYKKIFDAMGHLYIISNQVSARKKISTEPFTIVKVDYGDLENGQVAAVFQAPSGFSSRLYSQLYEGDQFMHLKLDEGDEKRHGVLFPKLPRRHKDTVFLPTEGEDKIAKALIQGTMKYHLGKGVMDDFGKSFTWKPAGQVLDPQEIKRIKTLFANFAAEGLEDHRKRLLDAGYGLYRILGVPQELRGNPQGEETITFDVMAVPINEPDNLVPEYVYFGQASMPLKFYQAAEDEDMAKRSARSVAQANDQGASSSGQGRRR